MNSVSPASWVAPSWCKFQLSSSPKVLERPQRASLLFALSLPEQSDYFTGLCFCLKGVVREENIIKSSGIKLKFSHPQGHLEMFQTDVITSENANLPKQNFSGRNSWMEFSLQLIRRSRLVSSVKITTWDIRGPGFGGRKGQPIAK